MYLQGVWFLIAGVLLLGPTPGLAEPYLRVHKNGVIYYYFTNQGPRQPGLTIPGPPASVKSPSPSAADVPLAATSPPGALDPEQSKPGTSEAQENIWAAIRYPIKMLTKLGCFSPWAQPGDKSGPQQAEGRQGVPSPQKSQVMAPNAQANPLNSAQEPGSAWGLAPPAPGRLTASDPRGYCFPLGGVFSFRDSWGDRRPGGRQHRAVDIFAREGTPVYAVTAGVIQTLATYPGGGITLKMLGQDGRGYGYMHLQGYAPGIMKGKVVRAGELIGYVGRTGIRQGQAHLHFQVYADHRLGKDELLNPYHFLVQLCQGIGVEDLSHQRVARLADPEIKVKGIQVYRRPEFTALRTRDGRQRARDSAILVIKNF
ncbi:MAG: peptidoglycan DD-metalloendopeptidase family protein [Thermodesulfobacteriota bacterium]